MVTKHMGVSFRWTSGVVGKQPGLPRILLCLSVLIEGFCMLQISRSTEVVLFLILLRILYYGLFYGYYFTDIILIYRNSPDNSHLSPLLHHRDTKSKTQFAP